MASFCTFAHCIYDIKYYQQHLNQNNGLITISFIREKIQICFPKNFNIYCNKCNKIYLFNSTALIADEDITRTRG